MTRTTGIVFFLLLSLCAAAQGDQQVRAKADGLFDEKNYVEALPLYSQLVSLAPSDRVLNYKFGTCSLFGGTDKDKAIGHLKFATQDPAIPPDAWYWLGRAFHLNYQFKDAQAAYQRYQGTGSKKELEGFPIASLDKQCRNGQNLLSNLKEITVHNKVEAEGTEFFRFYELGDIGGKIVVLPEELKSSLDKKSKQRTLVYLPEKGGAIYFASYGKDGKTGRDIYRTELLTNGTFAPPVKLAGYVNTDQDEDFAFLHPDGRNFYFSSKGHNSMGGYDVFRSAYDKVSDTFGPAENMDFAVNTPDDDVFYVTDAENKLACFASGRDSEQGKLHVYKVGTAQVPLVVTVLKGTYASAFDKDDRKAHIMVEDAVTHERVADVRTDINGSYVLSLPRSGRFRYLVECGPSGRTHTGTVDVPRASSARAYRQELELTRKGDLEELVIRNYFDAPLEEDMIALMMEEIKRRAKLDVTGDRPAVVAQQNDAQQAEGDVLTQAGFAGDVTEEKAVELARDDAREQEALVRSLDDQSKSAYAIAVDASAAAERLAREATAEAEQATTIADEAERNTRMGEAAELRQRSREANLRARAAYHAATDLDAERMAAQQRATAAGKLATDLGTAISSAQQQATLTHLRTLKQRLDTKAGPEGDISMAERARRNLAEQEKEAARRVNMATAKRAEETEFADRIERQKRERDETRSKARKEELSREITEQEQQLAYLHAEVEGAFNTAREQERSTAVMRGQHSLIQHLSTQSGTTTGADPTKEQVSTLGQRIAGNDARIAAIPVDARFDGAVNEQVTAMEARSFNWQLSDDRTLAVAASTPTLARQGGENNGATTEDPSNGAVASSMENGAQRNATEVMVPTNTATDLANAGSAIGEVVGTSEGAREGQGTPRGVNSASTEADATTTVGVENDGMANRGSATTGTDGNGQDQRGAVDAGANSAGASGERDPDVNAQAPEDVAVNDAASSTNATTNEASSNGADRTIGDVARASEPAGNANTSAGENAERDAFLLQNEKAELEQAIAAERNAARRDELKAQLAALEARGVQNAAANDAAAQNAGTTDTVEPELSLEGVDMERMPVTFYPDTKEADIITLVYPGYTADKAKLESVTEPAARADGLSGLELMLADSLRGEMVRQAAVLELAPQQSDVVLPKIERLRMLRQQHVLEAERITREAEALAATEAEQRVGLERAARTVTYPPGKDPIADRFIAIHPDPQEVFSSKVEHRSAKVQEAVAAKEADIERMSALDARIDSLEETLVDLPRKEYEKRRRETDRLIDERMILRADLGQRSAFLSKEEWRHTTDSLKGIDKQLTSLGLAPDENLLRMAADMQANGKAVFAEAEAARKRADRTEDIIARDSLFREAYASELKALAQMDKAITVKTYLLGDRFQRGEALSYEEVAKRVLGINDETLLAAQATNAPSTTTGTGSTSRAADGVATEATIDVPVTAATASTTSAGEVERTTDGTATTAMEATNEAGTVNEVAPDGGASDEAAERARKEAQALADRTEQTLPSSSRMPAQRYEEFLTGESVVLKAEAMDPTLAPDLLASSAQKAARESIELEQRSLALSDSASSMEDSAVNASKRERERLTELAVRTRQQADSLHTASLQKAEVARDLELQKRDADQALALRERLVKYYYLTTEEQSLVMDDQDMSIYFQAKARALEQYDAATEAEVSARANRELGEVLRKEAEAAKADEVAGRITPAEGAAKRDVLYGRAELLAARADSLTDIAARLRGAANVNESQAGVMLQGLSPERSTEAMALEMRTRRTDAQQAQVRAPLGRDGATPASTGSASGQVAGAAAADPRTGTAQGSSEVVATTGRPTTGTAEAANTAIRTGAQGLDRPMAELANTDASVFVFPEVLDRDIFELRSQGERAEAIPMDARMPGGIIFKVQIGAFRSAIREEAFSDMTPVMGEHTENGLVRYTAGLFNGFQQAAAAKDKVRDRGYRDAFVVAYRDGVRIPLGEAMRATREPATSAAASTRTTPNTAMDQRAVTPAVAVVPASGTDAAATANTGETARTTGNTVLEPARTTTSSEPSAPVLIQRPLNPLPVTTPTPAATAEEILAKYPTSADAILESFAPNATADDYYDVPGAAPAVQVETIKGLFYTVQVGVYSKPVALDKLFNITPLNSERTETAKVRYTTGRYMDTEQARVRKDQAVSLGVKDAFVTAYLNGKRIPMQEAATLLQRFGPSILARP